MDASVKRLQNTATRLESKAQAIAEQLHSVLVYRASGQFQCTREILSLRSKLSHLREQHLATLDDLQRTMVVARDVYHQEADVRRANVHAGINSVASEAMDAASKAKALENIHLEREVQTQRETEKSLQCRLQNARVVHM